ncbi:MAG: DMT family transporter [Spirochaetales bacterium]|nr:DMT family transporter [Spirochaetales bacterium]
MHRRRKAYAYTLASVLLWSTVATAFKISLSFMDSATLLFYSSAFSAAALGGIILFRKQKCKDLRRTALRGAALGCINPFLYYLFLFKAYSLLPAQEAQSLNFTWPLVLVLLSAVFFHERPGVKDLFSLLVCFFGAWIVSSHGRFTDIHFSSGPGILLAVGSSVFWSVYWLINRAYRGDKTLLLFFSMAAGTVYCGLYLLFSGRMVIPPVAGLSAAAYVGCFEMGITFVLWSKALSFAESTAFISNLLYLSPFLSLLFISTILGEPVMPSTLVGLLLIVGGILIQKMQLPKSEKSGRL